MNTLINGTERGEDQEEINKIDCVIFKKFVWMINYPEKGMDTTGTIVKKTAKQPNRNMRFSSVVI